MSRPPLPGPALLAIASFFFAVMATLIGALHGQVSPGQLLVLRFATGAGAMALFFSARRQGPQLGRWPLLLVRAVLSSCAVYFYFFAIGEIGPGPATMLNFISPCYAAVFAPLFLHEKSSRWVLLGLVVATAGAALVALGAGNGGRPVSGLGLAAGVLSGIATAAAATSLRGLRRDTDPFSVYFAFCGVGLVLAMPVALPGWKPLDGDTWLIVVAICAVSLVGQLLYTWALGHTTTVTAGIANQLAPVFSFVMAVLFLGETPHLLTVGGAALCIAGVLLGLKSSPAPAVPSAAVPIPAAPTPASRAQ
jgi:drug/metabolite transporter (DMT)-like permease